MSGPSDPAGRGCLWVVVLAALAWALVVAWVAIVAAVTRRVLG